MLHVPMLLKLDRSRESGRE